MHPFGKLAVACLAVAAIWAPAAANAQCVPVIAGTSQFALNAGQHINAGTLSTAIEGDNLLVTYNTANGWELTEAQLWVGSRIGELPQTNAGNPTPGKFPFKVAKQNGVATQTFSIPLASPEINFSCPGRDSVYYLAAHAVVRKRISGSTYQTETAWSEGSRITAKGNWATFSTVTLACKCAEAQGAPASAATCNTAFAYDPAAHANFLDYGFSRWGWSNGPYEGGRRVLDIYAGAGQSDISKGYHAGYLTVDHNGSSVTVTYEAKPGWFLNETHLYVGGQMFPMVKQGNKLVATVSPGQFPYQHSLETPVSTDTYTVPVSGSSYVIAHAVACFVQQ